MKKLIFVLVGLVIVVCGILTYIHFRHGRNTLPAAYFSQKLSSVTAPKFDHIVIILEENKPEKSILGNAEAPYINNLAKQYAYATKYYAVTNPSLPNYLALTSGTTTGISNDCNPPSSVCQANVPNIADRLEQAHKTWRMYAEDMPSPCYGNNSGNYAVKHNPFMYYPDIRNNTTRCITHVVPFTQFSSDLRTANGLPYYAFISPNMCNDMHNCSIRIGDTWLSQQVPKILQSAAFTHEHSLLVIVWDEGNSANNNIPVILAGAAAKHGYVSSSYFSHYSLLHTIERNWGLQPLTQNDQSAPLMTEMLQ